MTFTIKDFKVSDFKDTFGNTAVNVAFEEFGEPVTWFVKDPSKVSSGMKLEGEVKPTKAQTSGKEYNRFYRDKPQDQQGGYSQGTQQRGSTKREYQPRDDHAIQAQWAIGQAVHIAIASGNPDAMDRKFIEEGACEFFDMIERVKNHDTPEEDKLQHETDVKRVVPNADKHVELSEIPF